MEHPPQNKFKLFASYTVVVVCGGGGAWWWCVVVVWCGNVVCVVWTKKTRKVWLLHCEPDKQAAKLYKYLWKRLLKIKLIESTYKYTQTNTKKNKEKKWKRMRQVTEGLLLLLSCRKNFWLQPSRGYNQPRRGKRLRQFSFCLPNIFVVSNGTTKERKSFDNVLFL